MKPRTPTNLAAFIGGLWQPEKKNYREDNSVLGKTFTGNSEIMKIISVLSGKYSNNKSVNKSEIDTKNPVSRFYIFILLFNQYFNAYSRKISPPFEKEMDAIAEALSIDKMDRIRLRSFLSTKSPIPIKITVFILIIIKSSLP